MCHLKEYTNSAKSLFYYSFPKVIKSLNTTYIIPEVRELFFKSVNGIYPCGDFSGFPLN